MVLATINCRKYLSVIALTALTFFSIAYCNAQSSWSVLTFGDHTAAEKFHISLDVGLNISTLPGLSQQQPIYGLNLGLGAFFKLSSKWALTTELKPISSRGASNVKSIYNDVTIQNPTTDIVTNYIDIPLLVQYAISKRFNIATGPQISFLTSANQRTTGNLSSGQAIVVSENIKSLMHKEGFMVPVQLGYSFSKTSSSSGVSLKIRYNIGIMEAFTTSLVESKNSTFQFIVSVPFIRRAE